MTWADFWQLALDLKPERGMTWLEFWASVIGSVVWPVALVFAVAVFRPQLTKLLNETERVQVANALELERKLVKVEHHADAALGQPDTESSAGAQSAPPANQQREDESGVQAKGDPAILPSSTVRPSPRDLTPQHLRENGPLRISRRLIEAMLASSPRRKIADAWQEVESTLNAVWWATGTVTPPSISPVVTAENLAGRGILDPELPPLIAELRQLWSLAINTTPDAHQAETYQELAARVLCSLKESANSVAVARLSAQARPE